MAAMLKREDEEKWLNPDIVEAERLLPLLGPYPADLMEKYAVGSDVGNPRNDSRNLIEPRSA